MGKSISLGSLSSLILGLWTDWSGSSCPGSVSSLRLGPDPFPSLGGHSHVLGLACSLSRPFP